MYAASLVRKELSTQPIATDLSMPFFFHTTAPTEIYTLSLHDALPIWIGGPPRVFDAAIRFDGDRLHTPSRSEEHTSELQSRENLVCRLLLEKKKHALAAASFGSHRR